MLGKTAFESLSTVETEKLQANCLKDCFLTPCPFLETNDYLRHPEAFSLHLVRGEPIKFYASGFLPNL